MRTSFRILVALAVCLPLLAGCPSPVGKACQKNSDCGGGLNCEQSVDFPTGTCTADCTVAGFSCPGDAVCAALTEGSRCLARCDSDKNCPSGQLCSSINAAHKVCVSKQADPSALTPTCGSPTFVAGGTVGPASEPSSCQKSVVEAASVPATVTHLGVHEVGEVLAFTVPPNTVGLSIVQQAVVATDSFSYQGRTIDNTVVPTTVVAPGARLLFDDTADDPADPTQAPVVYRSISAGTSAFTIPNTSALLAETNASGLPPGEWHFTVNDWAAECTTIPTCTEGTVHNTYDVTVLARGGPAEGGGTLDLGIYWVSSTALNAATAPANPSVQRALTALQTLYGRAGICLGTVTFYDLPDWALAKFATGVSADESLPCQDLDQLFTLSAPGNRLNLFFVDALSGSTSTPGTHVAGVDGTIPGPSGFGGTVKSGAVVSIADLTAGTCGANFEPTKCGADSVAYIAAHEAGHWLGLYHSAEQDGESLNPLADTPGCKCEVCAPASELKQCGSPNGTPTTIVGVDCSRGTQVCGAAASLMFWLLDGTSQGQLSPQQSQVMRLNPVVH